MNKKEQAAFADLQYDLRLAKALRWTEPVERDVKPPECGSGDWNKLRKGWDWAGRWNSWRVDKACTSSVSHAFGRDDGVDSQQPKALYSTRLRALRGMRNAVERAVAEELAKIDRQIEEEQQKGGE